MLLRQLYVAGLMASGALAGVPQIDFQIARGNSYAESKVGAKFAIKQVYNAKRDEIELELTNQATFYLAKVTVGSDEQEMDVLIDTGSSDFWLISSDVICVDAEWLATQQLSLSLLSSKRDFPRSVPRPLLHRRQPTKVVKAESRRTTDSSIPTSFSTMASYVTTDTCTLLGSFNTGTSDTFSANSTSYDFDTSYADGTEVIGVWGVDNVLISNLTLENVTFGVGEVATAQPGILGIGMMLLESTYSPSASDSYTYINFPAKLKEDGLISRNAFSLYLTEKAGTVLFGAVDTAKYEGTLFSLPLVNTLANYGYTKPAEFAVALSGLTIGSDNNTVTISSTNYAAVLDSGTTLSYFPLSVMSNLAEALGAQYVSSAGVYELDCPSDSLEFVFNFNGGKITIALNEFISESSGQCYLNILPNSEGSASYLFGDNFLQHVYVVYDADALEIAMAPIKDTSESNILILSEVVSATQVSGYSNTDIATSDASSGSVSTQLALGTSGSSTSTKNNDAGIVSVTPGSLIIAFFLSILCIII